MITEVSPLGDASLECREVNAVLGPQLSMCWVLVVCGYIGICSLGSHKFGNLFSPCVARPLLTGGVCSYSRVS